LHLPDRDHAEGLKPSNDTGGRAEAANIRAMPVWRPVLCAIAALAVALDAGSAAGEGHLVLVGGGPTPADVFSRALALSGGRSAIVAVLPQTFPADTIADAAVTMWRTFQPREVVKVSRTDPVAARAALE